MTLKAFFATLLISAGSASHIPDMPRATAQALLKYEGTEYHNNPKDPGGPTKYGWTLRSYRKLVSSSATKEDIKRLTAAEAVKLYNLLFWKKYGAWRITHHHLATTAFLAQVNIGPSRPNKLLQQMSNDLCDTHLKIDGILGPYSAKAINNCEWIWPGYPYILHELYENDPSIQAVWKWAKKGLRKRILHSIRLKLCSAS